MSGVFKKRMEAACNEPAPHRGVADRAAGALSLRLATGVAGAVWVLFPLAATAQDPMTAPSSPAAQTEPTSDCPGYSVCPVINFQDQIKRDPDTKKVNAGITATEAATLAQILIGGYSADPSAPVNAKSILGKVMIYDRNLSVNDLVACATCHTASEGFTGGSSLVNDTTVAFVGAVGDRASQRSPMSYAYAPFAPVLYYRSSTNDFVGGNFWDDRATGLVTGNPAADQALGPPLNPLEMANPDAACVVYHLSQSKYRSLFEQVWGQQSFAINWPSDTATLCAQPGSTHDSNPTVLNLTTADRDQANTTFNNMGLAMAAYEASPEVSPFSSKFDAVIAGKAQFTPIEQEGYNLFTGSANCSQCHAVNGAKSMFTDYTAVNLGVPKNVDVPYYTENLPDTYGYIANPEGPAYTDIGVADFLTSTTNTNAAWTQLAPQFMGTFQVASLRNVAMKTRTSFVKSYMHNGYFKNLAQVVHFYNTRDVLPTCPSSMPSQIGGDVGTKCWPAPEVPTNVNHTQTGNLGLSPEEEASIVAFLQTLSDGYTPDTAPHSPAGPHFPPG
jgi:cytochrome c peroxidase